MMSQAKRLSTLNHRSELTNAFAAARRGGVRRSVIVVLAVLTVVVGAGSWYFTSGAGAIDEHPLTGPVVVGKFVHEIVERGDVESSANVEVRSEVQLRGSLAGIAIVELVPEGTFVEQGDFLVRLDDSALQNELQLQQINVNASQADVIQAQTAVETAKLTLSEYESGTFKQDEEQLQSENFVAEENFRRAEEYFMYSKRLATKGYVSPVQLDADRFGVEKAQKELDVARTKMQVLRTFTKQKMIKQLDADVKTAEAKLQAALENHSVESSRLDRIKQQITRCIITAPKAGQVVYANQPGIGNNDGIVIEEGRLVRERQVLIRLPNPKQMQVTAKINESRIDLVRSGMPARIKVDALEGLELTGIVRKVGEYPSQQSSAYLSHIKEYETEIEILDPPAGLRPGMTAQAAVLVEERANAAQVPLQAVTERDGRYYCLVQTADGLEARQIQIGPTNEKFVVVEAGLKENEQVVMTPKQFEGSVSLPTPVEFPARKPTMLARDRVERAPRVAKSDVTEQAAKRETAKRLKPLAIRSTPLEAVPVSHGAGL